MSTIAIFSHNDLDGVGAPLVLRHELVLKHGIDHRFYYQHGNYNDIDQRILSFIEEDKFQDLIGFYITDISITKETADILEAYCKEKNVELLLFDHHGTALWMNEAYEWAHVVINGKDGRQHSATSLVFEHFEGVTPEQFLEDLKGKTLDVADMEEKACATFASIIRSYDTWSWSNNPEDPWKEEANDYNRLFFILGKKRFMDKHQHILEPYYGDGERLLLDMEKEKEEKYIDIKTKYAHYTTLSFEEKTYTVAYTSAESYGSSLGNALALLPFPETNEQVDVGMVIDNGKISLRTAKDTVDVSILAKGLFSGGGHPKASGGKHPYDLKWIVENKF